MKKLNIFLLGALIFALTFSSCNKHDDEPENKQTPVENTSGNTNTPSGDTEVTPEKVTVTFNVSGGTGSAEPQTVEKGTKITLPDGLKKDGYKFLGWSLTENGEIITEYTVTESDVKLYAVWLKVFTVKFDTDGGTKITSQTIEKGKTATKPEIRPTKKGFIFDGWNYNNAAFDFSTAITADVTVTAKWIAVPEDCIPGLFSVSDNKKVFFSKGNLQYNTATSKFQFAATQLECIGDGGANTGETGIRDLFGWGTWLVGGNPMNNRKPYNSEYTWDDTKSSAIGPDWQTLTGNELCYLFNYDGSEYYSTKLINGENTIRAGKFGKGTISLGNNKTIQGVILLPDDWEHPTDLSKEFNSAANSWDNNTYTENEWLSMEANGAVFLPAAGYRYGSDVLDVGGHGYYWSATAGGTDVAFYLYFGSVPTYVSLDFRCDGQSVRLVRVLQN